MGRVDDRAVGGGDADQRDDGGERQEEGDVLIAPAVGGEHAEEQAHDHGQGRRHRERVGGGDEPAHVIGQPQPAEHPLGESEGRPVDLVDDGRPQVGVVGRLRLGAIEATQLALTTDTADEMGVDRRRGDGVEAAPLVGVEQVVGVPGHVGSFRVEWWGAGFMPAGLASLGGPASCGS